LHALRSPFLKVNPLVRQARQWLEGHRSERIGVFHFDIVQGCQLSCIGCPNSNLHPAIDHISSETFDRCLQNVDAKHVGVFRLFNYGEPFLHPNIRGLLDVLKRQPWKARLVEISTNAMIFDETNVRDIISSNAVTTIVASCDGDGTPEEFERLRPPARWDSLMLFLNGVARIKKEIGSGIALKTRTVCPTAAGRKRWSALLKPMGWQPEFRDWIVLPNTIQKPWTRQARVGNMVCRHLAGVNLFVNCHGDVVPCCAYPDFESLGNLKTQKFSEIHRGLPRRRMIEHLKADRVSDGICGACEE
jgi:sulfatase maturation enzyme AslB (radical SAM superfamily)